MTTCNHGTCNSRMAALVETAPFGLELVASEILPKVAVTSQRDAA